MPIIQLSFDNPLNTSVQVGDNAYFSNPTPVSSVGNPLGGQWTSTTTPHMTNDIDGVVDLGEILTITPWNGTNSFITCDMDQVLFNKYFSSIVAGGCVIAPTGPCLNKTVITYAALQSNSAGFVDPQASTYWSSGGLPGPDDNGPLLYSHTSPSNIGSSQTEDNMREKHEFNAMVLHWFWNNDQTSLFSDYVFEDWDGGIWRFDSFIKNETSGPNPTQVGPGPYTLTGGTALHFIPSPPTVAPDSSGHLYSVHEIIDLWQAEYAAHSSFALAAPYDNWSSSRLFPLSTLAASSGSNSANIVYGGSFETFWNRVLTQPGAPPSIRVSPGGIKSPCVGSGTVCTTGSYIMFSKDNKANMSSILGYYASVEYRNSSQIKSELFNVGTDFFESSK